VPCEKRAALDSNPPHEARRGIDGRVVVSVLVIGSSIPRAHMIRALRSILAPAFVDVIGIRRSVIGRRHIADAARHVAKCAASAATRTP